MEGGAGFRNDILGVDGVAGWMFFRDGRAVFVDGLGEPVDKVVVCIGGGDEVHGADIETFIIGVLSPIGVGGDGVRVKEGILHGEVLALIRIERDKPHGLMGGGLHDGGGWDGAAEESGIGRAILEEFDSAGLVLVEGGEVVVGDAVGVEDGGDKGFHAGAGGADDDAFAFEILQGLNAGVGGGDEEGDVGCHGGDGPDWLRIVLPIAFAVDRIPGDGGVGHGEVKLALQQTADILGGTAGRFRADDVAFVAAGFLECFGDGRADDEEGSSGWCGAEGDELALGRGGGGGIGR